MSKYYITVSEFHSMLEKLNSMDDYDSMLIYAPEYHKLAEISCVCHDVYGKEVHLVETPFETVLAVTQIPDEFIELPKKKEGTDPNPFLIKDTILEEKEREELILRYGQSDEFGNPLLFGYIFGIPNYYGLALQNYYGKCRLHFSSDKGQAEKEIFELA